MRRPLVSILPFFCGPDAAAYGWSDYSPEMPDEEILKRLLALNLQRKAAERT